jgi:nucleotide-binding universal stress UspA family protein
VNQLVRVLTAVDFSEPGRAAFDQALALSRESNAELTVVHAVPKEHRFRWGARERITMIAAQREAADAAGVRYKVSVQHGDPARVISLHARARRPGLIVLGTHQRTGMDRFRLGSVAETITLRATQPVLIVPAAANGEVAESATSFENIVVAVDFSTATDAVVQKALSMASTKGRLTLVHVVQGIPPASVSRYTADHRVPEYQRLIARDAWRRLQDTIPARARTSGRVHARVVVGDPATEIARVATDISADLILVGVTARGAIARRIFGATAARLIRIAGRPVLAVPEVTRRAAPPSANASELRVAA